tara:strand:- start:212 stop:385 length:174 start_codon:yes stop_codon:yes gene_type:complete
MPIKNVIIVYMRNFLLTIIDFKISILKNVRRHLTGEAKMDKNYKRWRTQVKDWVKNR